jgi:hypothetical protein
MSFQQREVLATVIISLCGGASWSFLLYSLYFSMAAPTLG